MLRSIGDIAGYAIEATDGVVGRVRDFYFDDATWVIRYFIVETGDWLSSRKVLIAPIETGSPDHLRKALPVSITQAEVRNSPDLDTNRPVSRQHEKRFMALRGYSHYWSGAGLWGDGSDASLLTSSIDPITMMRLQRDAEQEGGELNFIESDCDIHLRSLATILTYRLQATDGEVGNVEGLLVEDSTWAIRYLIVNTGRWWLGHKVLISPSWTERIDWFDGTLAVSLTRQQVKDAPPYEAESFVERDREIALHKHYGRRGYWSNDPDF